MNFDLRSIPNNTVLPFTSKYMEAKVLEDYKLLNLITEKYDAGYITESEALTLINMVRMNESEKVRIIKESTMYVEDEFYETVTPLMHQFNGETLLPMNQLIHVQEGTSVYKEYAKDRNWDDSSLVGRQATIVADEKDKNLKSFIESSGKEGFDKETRDIFKTFPDNIPSSGEVYESLVDHKFITGVLNPTSAVILHNFFENSFQEFSIAAMQPPEVLPENPSLSKPIPTETGDVSLNASTENMVATTDAQISTKDKMIKLSYDEDLDEKDTMEAVRYLIDDMMRFNGFNLYIEGTVYKNNPIFDSETKKLYGKMREYLKVSNPSDADASIAECINEEKTRYNFHFKEDIDVTPEQISGIISSLGFTPVKNNGKILHYEKNTKGLNMKVHFTSINGGVEISYEKNVPVKESTIDDKIKFATSCDSSDVRDAAKRLKNIISSGDKDKIKEAMNNLDHAIDNYKEVQKEQKKDVEKVVKDVKESSSIDELYTFLTENVDEELFGHISDAFSKVGYEGAYIREFTYVPTMICDILRDSPTKEVFESTLDMVTDLYSSPSKEEFLKKIDTFCENLETQIKDEYACERVLDDIEFMEETNPSEIDEDIKSTVELLNRLGYKVKYSCSGHTKTRIKEDGYNDGVYHGKLYTTARLTFDKKYSFDSLPEGWYENKNVDTTSIYVRAFNYDKKNGTPNEAFEKWKQDYMSSLKKWVENLKEAKDTDEGAKTESVLKSLEEDFLSIQLITENNSVFNNNMDTKSNNMVDLIDKEFYNIL